MELHHLFTGADAYAQTARIPS